MAVTSNGKLVVVTDPMKAMVRAFTVSDRKEKFAITVPGDSLVATAEVPGSPSPEGIAVSRDSKWAFVTLQGRNRVITIDLAKGTIVRYAPTGTWSDGIGYSPVKHSR
jgi:DNA-binding beta-propeller fold protein YncE